MPQHDTILAVLSSGIGLAGLLLIFAGFLFSKATSFDGKRGDKFKVLARSTLIPTMMALGLAWMSIMALENSLWAALNLMAFLKATLGITAIFALVGILAGSP